MLPLLALVGACLTPGVRITIRKPSKPVLEQPAVPATDALTGTPLVVVGAGKLGQRVAALWQEAEGGEAPIYALTRRADKERDATLRAGGIIPCQKGDPALPARCAHVVFCVPPGQSVSDMLLYSGKISPALGLWDQEADGASFVFTSSAGVYAENDGSVVREESLTADTVRAMRLLAAESLVAGCGGTVLRLAGLYDLDHGAHNIYLGRPSWAADAEGLINQVHYGDAAAAVVAALRRPSSGETLLVADDRPMSRADICAAAVRLPKYRGEAMPTFSGGYGGIGGKVCDSSHTRSLLQWQPQYSTFQDFVDAETSGG